MKKKKKGKKENYLQLIENEFPREQANKCEWFDLLSKELKIEKTRNYLRGYRRSLKEKSAKCRGTNLSSPEIHVILFAISSARFCSARDIFTKDRCCFA